MMTTLRILIVFLSLFLLGSGENSTAYTFKVPETQMVFVEGNLSYTKIDAKGLADMLKRKDFLFVNVHIPYEGEIEKTDLFIPYNEIEENINKLPSDKDAGIVLYCRTDRMSNIAARTLVKLGYRNVWILESGMVKWKEEGYPLLNKIDKSWGGNK
jgi:rhodanese-related sulfurtransferase